MTAGRVKSLSFSFFLKLWGPRHLDGERDSGRRWWSLKSELPSGTLVDGKLTGLTREGKAFAILSGDKVEIVSSFVFGCDGLRSTVRQSLAAMEHLASEFQLQVIKTPSTGLLICARVVFLGLHC